MGILIIGAGGHGQVVADILLQRFLEFQGRKPIGYLDDSLALAGQIRLSLPVLGTIADLKKITHSEVIVAIGENLIRKRIFEFLQNDKVEFSSAIHPTAILGHEVIVGIGTVVCAGAIVNPASLIGSNAILNTGCTIDHHNYVGDHVHIAPGVRLGGEVSIGEGAFIGIGAIIMPRIRIGKWSFVGAGSLVCSDVPDNALFQGSPAKLIRHLPSKPTNDCTS